MMYRRDVVPYNIRDRDRKPFQHQQRQPPPPTPQPLHAFQLWISQQQTYLNTLSEACGLVPNTNGTRNDHGKGNMGWFATPNPSPNQNRNAMGTDLGTRNGWKGNGEEWSGRWNRNLREQQHHGRGVGYGAEDARRVGEIGDERERRRARTWSDQSQKQFYHPSQIQSQPQPPQSQEQRQWNHLPTPNASPTTSRPTPTPTPNLPCIARSGLDPERERKRKREKEEQTDEVAQRWCERKAAEKAYAGRGKRGREEEGARDRKGERERKVSRSDQRPDWSRDRTRDNMEDRGRREESGLGYGHWQEPSRPMPMPMRNERRLIGHRHAPLSSPSPVETRRHSDYSPRRSTTRFESSRTRQCERERSPSRPPYQPRLSPPPRRRADSQIPFTHSHSRPPPRALRTALETTGKPVGHSVTGWHGTPPPDFGPSQHVHFYPRPNEPTGPGERLVKNAPNLDTREYIVGHRPSILQPPRLAHDLPESFYNMNYWSKPVGKLSGKLMRLGRSREVKEEDWRDDPMLERKEEEDVVFLSGERWEDSMAIDRAATVSRGNSPEPGPRYASRSRTSSDRRESLSEDESLRGSRFTEDDNDDEGEEHFSTALSHACTVQEHESLALSLHPGPPHLDTNAESPLPIQIKKEDSPFPPTPSQADDTSLDSEVVQRKDEMTSEALEKSRDWYITEEEEIDYGGDDFGF